MIGTRSPRAIYQIYMALAIIEGLVAEVLFLRVPSESENALFFGYSASRIMLGGVVLVVMVFCGWALVTSFLRPHWLDKIHRWLEEWIFREDRWLIVFIVLLYLAFVGGIGIMLFRSHLFQDYSTYSEIFKSTTALFETIASILIRAWPLLFWLLALIFQTGLFLILGFPKLSLNRNTFKGEVMLNELIVLSVITFSLIHWIILAMQMRVFANIPGWYWDILAKPFSLRDGLFLLLLALSMVLVGYVLNHPGHTKRNLLIIFALGWVVQVGFGVIEGQGFESLRLKYATSLHRSHALKASADDISLLATVREYEDLYGGTMFQSTKPPGTLLIYIMTRYISDWITPQSTPEGRFLVLTTFEAYVFPFISFVVVFVIYQFSKELLPEEDRLLPGILYILLPNVILLTLFLDQVLYPLLFISGAYIVIKMVEKRTFQLAVLSGALIYLCAFFTFSLLPLIPFAFLYIGIDFLTNRPDRRVLNSLSLFLGILVGLGLMFVIFYYALDYNAFTRYQGAMKVVRNFDFLLRVDAPRGAELPNTGFLLPPRYILSAFTLNNVEFASAVGFPIYLLFIVQGVATLSAFVKRKTTRQYGILASFLATFLAMNIFAPIQGEAARLWIFWTPMIVLFAGSSVAALFKPHNRMIYLLVFLQLTTIYLTFKFQDLAP
jgi:hypothetical protein